MTGDPDDLNWLDYDWISQRWDRWRERFISHYGLSDEQIKQLDELLDGPDRVGARLSALPEGVRLPSLVTYDPERKALYVEADRPLTESDVRDVLSTIPAEGELNQEFRKALQTLGQRSERLSVRRRLRGLMLGDAERVGATAYQRENSIIYEPRMGTVLSPDDETALLKYGDAQRYKDMLAKYEREYAAAKTDSDYDHLSKEWEQIQRLRLKLVQPAMNLEQDLLTQAWELLTPEQLAKGRLEYDDSPIHDVNRLTMWSLIVLGGLLIVGFLTPLAALAAAVMIFMFYLPIPPWPGVPQPPGPEHSFIVNKNLIESLALLAIAALPTGRWFGVDALITRMFGRRRVKSD